MANPINAVFLGIDPAKHTSGAVLLEPVYGEQSKLLEGYAAVEFGKVISQEERERFIESLIDTALENDLTPILVAEEWDPPRDRRIRTPQGWVYVRDQKWTYETILGIGEGWGRWTAAIEHGNAALADEKLPPLPVLRVRPNAWRDALFGARRARHTDELKAAAERYYEMVFGYAASSDIAEGGCIALYGTTAVEAAEADAAWQKAAKELRTSLKRKGKTQRR
jgi:hypothetical protein